MNKRRQQRNRKWSILGATGLLSGLATLLLFRSLPTASGTAAATILGIVVLKHVALFVAVSSPLAALFQTLKPRLRALCGRPPEDED